MANKHLMQEIFRKAAVMMVEEDFKKLKDLWPEVKMSNKKVDEGVTDLSSQDKSVKLRMIPEYVAVLERLEELEAQVMAMNDQSRCLSQEEFIECVRFHKNG